MSTLAINDGQLFLVVLSLFWLALFILSRLFRWDAITYEQFKHSRIIWYWLDTFGVPKTRKVKLPSLYARRMDRRDLDRCRSSLFPLFAPVAENRGMQSSNLSVELTATRL